MSAFCLLVVGGFTLVAIDPSQVFNTSLRVRLKSSPH